jgi:hypothetical protein
MLHAAVGLCRSVCLLLLSTSSSHSGWLWYVVDACKLALSEPGYSKRFIQQLNESISNSGTTAGRVGRIAKKAPISDSLLLMLYRVVQSNNNEPLLLVCFHCR